jgi:hypothetical protein
MEFENEKPQKSGNDVPGGAERAEETGGAEKKLDGLKKHLDVLAGQDRLFGEEKKRLEAEKGAFLRKMKSREDELRENIKKNKQKIKKLKEEIAQLEGK